MSPILTFLLCAWATGQPGDGDWLLAPPRLARGQELLYRGSVTEETRSDGGHASHSYGLEARTFVLDATASEFTLAVLTTLRDPSTPADAPPGSVRLQTVAVDHRGRVVSAPGTAQGPATGEVAALAELPAGRVGVGTTWDAADGDRPPRSWRAVGTETVAGVRCLKLVGVQQTADWDRPGDRAAWRRQDVLWLALHQAVVQRAERSVEQRSPGRVTPDQCLRTTYQLERVQPFSPQLEADRRREILRADQFRKQLDALLAGSDPRPSDFDVLDRRIAQYLESQQATPYRDAVLWVRRRATAGRDGEGVPVVRPAEVVRAVATVGSPAPDFVAADLATREPTRLSHWRGRPAVLLFYDPSKSTAAESLKALDALRRQFEGRAEAAALCVTDEAGLALTRRAEWGLTVPVLAGREVQALYVPDTTPRWVVLDAAGVVRYAELGWGRELPSLVAGAVRRCLESTGSIDTATRRHGDTER